MGGKKVSPLDASDKHVGELKGPVTDRKFTDCLFFILFVAFWAGMFVIAGYAGENGNLDYLLYGQDSNGSICGVDNPDGGPNLEGKKFLYWPEINKDFSMCLASCPGKKSSDAVLSESEFQLASVVGATCGQTDVLCPSINDESLIVLNGGIKCCPYKTDSIFYRCYPDYDNISSSVTEFATNSVNSPSLNGQKYLADVYKTWEYQILFAAIALVTSFIMLFFVSIFGHMIVWFVIFLVIGVMCGVTAYLWDYANDSEDDVKDDVDIKSENRNSDAARILAYIMIAVTCLTILLVIVLRKRIRLAVAIFREGGRCLSQLPMMLLIPVLMFCGFILLVIYWIYILLLLASAHRTSSTTATVIDTTNATEPAFITTDGVNLQENKETVQYLAIYHFFGLLWTTNFLIAVGQIAIAGSTISWYFSRDKRSVGNSAVFSSLFRAGFYHAGTAAFGGLVVAIVQFIRAWQEYLQHQQEKAGQGNTLTRSFWCCIRCCLACIERFLKFLSKNAFIMTALYGDSFCKGARRSFKLILRNILRVAAVNWVSDFLIFLIKILVTGVVALVAIGVFDNIDRDQGKDQEQIAFWIIPVILACIIAYFIASLFGTVLEMVIDTILLCFLEDEERSSNGEFAPYMSGDLAKYMGEAALSKQKEMS